GAAALGAGLWALSRDLLLPVAPAIVTLALATGARLAFEAAVAWRERVRLRGVFAGYVSPQVMAEIEAGRLEGLASARRFICVLVMDVRGFTTRAEREPPDRVLALLNDLAEQATAAIHGRGGTVDKFMGDGVLAFFGAPARMDDPCGAAFDAAIEVLERVRRIGDTARGPDGAPLAIGIGLACGEATVGHVGAATRHSYTAIGDCVNVASRLESLTKEVGVPLVMTKDVAMRIGERPGLVPLGVHAIKGHTSLEVVGWR
ncbi:MAG: adenylate/guanylate cyclase domain-containing protein, partial [Betaproteobacteria bacterium PRO3]|nr:adenylate/guanylate cyclase domain-containing protein [Betaproteobacteria bacterium PRO3]